jgi:hypothetical protein
MVKEMVEVILRLFFFKQNIYVYVLFKRVEVNTHYISTYNIFRLFSKY